MLPPKPRPRLQLRSQLLRTRPLCTQQQLMLPQFRRSWIHTDLDSELGRPRCTAQWIRMALALHIAMQLQLRLQQQQRLP